VLQKQQPAARAQDTPHLRHDLIRIVDRAERKGAHNCVKTRVTKRDVLAHAFTDRIVPSMRTRTSARIVEQSRVRIDARKARYLTGLIEFLIEPAAATELKYIARRKRYEL